MKDQIVIPMLINEIKVVFLRDNEETVSQRHYTYYVCYDLEYAADIPSNYFSLKGLILDDVKAAYKEQVNFTEYDNSMLVISERRVDPTKVDFSYKFLFGFNTTKLIPQLRTENKPYCHYNKYDIRSLSPIDCHNYNSFLAGASNLIDFFNKVAKAKEDNFICLGSNSYNNYVFVKKQKQTSNNNKKESNKMNVMKGMNFEFGPVGREIKLAVGGMAFRNNEGGYVTYNVDTNTITDVTDFTFDINGMLYAIPVAIDQIKKNDVINHKGNYVIAIADFDKEKGNTINVVNPITQTKETILPTQNIFGFNFVTKVVNFAAGMFDTTPNADNPFGNIMPMMLMSSVMNDDTDSNDFMKIMIMSQIMQNGNFFQSAENNPFSNMMPFMMMKSIMGDN